MSDGCRRADASASRRHGGLGLGLSLVRTLTELHGGSVSATSVVGARSVFSVTFPGRTERTESPATAPAEDDFMNALSGLRVLVVEDQPDAREILSARFSPFGGG